MWGAENGPTTRWEIIFLILLAISGCRTRTSGPRPDVRTTSSRCAPPAPFGDEYEPPMLRANICGGRARYYFVDASSDHAAPPEDFAVETQKALDAWLAQLRCDHRIPEIFDCDHPVDGPACLEADARGAFAVLEPVLEERAGVPWRGRRTGHRRFFRIAFFDPKGRILSVRDSSHCDVVSTLRALVETRRGEAVLRVGRTWCTAQSLQVDWGVGHRAFTPGGHWNARATWHLAHLGLEDPGRATAAWPILTSPPGARLALLDTRLPAIAAASGAPDLVSNEVRFVDGTRAATHRHGATMAVLARSLAGPIAIDSAVVLDDSGHGSVATIARGLDHVLFHQRENVGPTTSAAPIVINMSLGLPPELEAQSTIRCGEDEAVQDGIAEPVRYLLRLAAEQDAPQRPVLVVAAAGNRVLRDSQPSYLDAATSTTSSLRRRVRPTSDTFYPAALQAERGAIVLSAHAVDHRGRSWRPAGKPRARRLVVPATGVFAFPVMVDGPWLKLSTAQDVHELDPYGWSASPEVPRCDPRGPPGVQGYVHPSATSGTSVASVLTSAAAIAAFSVSSGDLSGRAVARLAYLTGVDPVTGRATRNPTRRLCVPRLLNATRRGSSNLRRCLERPDAELLSDRLDTCRADLPREIDEHQCPPAMSQPTAWPQEVASKLGGDGVCTTHYAGARRVTWSSAPFDDGTLLTTDDASVLGPQPGGGGCIPPCAMMLDGKDLSDLDLYLSLTPELPDLTEFVKPTLVIRQGEVETTLDLSSLTKAGAWYPGAALHISGIPAPDVGIDFGAKDLEATLVMTIVQRDSETLDFSSLEVVRKL